MLDLKTMVQVFLNSGGSIKVGNARKAINSRTFGVKSACWKTGGRKSITLQGKGFARGYKR